MRSFSPCVTLLLNEKCLEGSEWLFLSTQCRSALWGSIIIGPPAPDVRSMNNPPGDLKNSQCVAGYGCLGAALTSPVLSATAAGAQQPRLYLPFKFPRISRMLTNVESLEFEWGKGRNDARLAFFFMSFVKKKRLTMRFTFKRLYYMAKEKVHFHVIKRHFWKDMDEWVSNSNRVVWGKSSFESVLAA